MQVDYLIMANIEHIDDIPFMVLIVLRDVRQVDTLIKKYETQDDIFNTLMDMSVIHGTMVYELWTSTKEIFKETIKQSGVNVKFKHGSDTTVTNSAIKTDEALLREIYEIEPEDIAPEDIRPEGAQPQLPQWRAVLINWLGKLIKLIGGKYIHDQENS